ncbi:hypothetical protein [Marinobacterium aestuariivivens]|uniref:Uncharacterized protein n=1 Tax=Marinobacterium aestuariivivens TaxID=1698799 RepID=A0ABW2A8G0_9GAMM
MAFPQSGLMIRPGTRELMEAAVDAGAEVVGGIDPSSIDRDPAGHLDTIFAIADRKGWRSTSICTNPITSAPPRSR